MNANSDAPKISRRKLIGMAGTTTVFAASAIGCDLLSTTPDRQNDAGQRADAAKGPESPMLAEQVDAGKLPPVAERLPSSPLKVDTVDRIGSYGGEWRTATLGTADWTWPYRTTAYEHLMNWDPKWTEPVPNVAESVEIGRQGREFTFHLREGMKWSDGEPFTAEDIDFAYRDVFLNEALTPSPPSWLAPEGTPAKTDVVDRVTIRFTFSQPQGLFLANIAQPAGQGLTNKPKHYLKDFHQDYAPDADEAAEEAGFSSWFEFFLSMSNPWERAGLPTITPWMVTDPLGEGRGLVVERNPYYWKTDPEDSQLPYIDRVVFELVEEEQALLVKAANGELDMHGRHITELQNKPVLARSREEESFHFSEVQGAAMNEMMIGLNLTHKNPVKREIFQNRDFRIGLSHAINRQEIIDTAFQGQGEPWQAGPRRDAPELFDEELAKQYTDFDVDRANEYLDRAGYSEYDDEGFRLGPDQQRISFTIDAVGDQGSRIDALGMIKQYWQDVGVDMSFRSMDSSLMYERREANEHDGSYGAGEGGLLWDAVLDPRWYFPHSPTESTYAIPWANWFQNAAEPMEEPPEATRRQMEIYRQLEETLDESEQVRLLQQILQIAKEQFYAIGIVLPAPKFAIVKNNFYNVPDSMPDSWMYVGPGPTVPAQYFIDSE